MIRNVYLWANSMLMVFDEHGQQMPAYQGPAEECLDRILADAPSSAEWHVGRWNSDVWTTSRQTFARIGRFCVAVDTTERAGKAPEAPM